jgi:hypothetical protein
MLSTNQSLYYFVWNCNPQSTPRRAKSTHCRNPKNFHWRDYKTTSLIVAKEWQYYMDVEIYATMEDGVDIYRISPPFPRKNNHQKKSHRCLNSPPTHEEREEDKPWDDVLDEEEEDARRTAHIKQCRVAHFSRKRKAKDARKQKKKNIWKNKKASKKRRK